MLVLIHGLEYLSVIIQTKNVKLYVNMTISKLSMKALDKLLQKGSLSSMSLAFSFLNCISRLNFIIYNNITLSNHTSWTRRIYYHKIQSLFLYVYFSIHINRRLHVYFSIYMNRSLHQKCAWGMK